VRSRQPALDGLRGAAVVAVVLYHAGVPGAVGGYLGVDAFFVLSGYLITGLLLEEWERRGAIDVTAFWVRRLRRLVPAVLLTLVGVAALCLVLDPALLGSVRGDGVATVAYAMNWRLIGQSSSYFDQFTVSPLTHVWSLAIEEQFYLVWPLAVVAVLRIGRSVRAVLVGTVGLAAASAAWMVVSYRPDVDPSRLYLGTDTRAQALLIGAALSAALATGVRVESDRTRRRLVAAAGAGAGVVVLAWTRLPGTAAVLYRGGFTVLATIVALVILAGTQLGDNPVRRTLSFGPLRALGLVSYGVYLYHLPIFIWLDSERTGWAADSAGLLVLRLSVTLAAASSSYLLVEQPVREGRLDRLQIGAAMRPGLVPAAIVLALALLGAATTRATPGVADTPSAGRPVAPPAQGEARVLVVGDSVAYSLALGLDGPVSAENHLSVWNDAVLFCELLPYPRQEAGLVLPASRTCEDWEARWRRDVAGFRPDLAVLQVGAWEIFDRLVDDEVVVFGSPASDRLLDDVLERAVAALGAGGAPVAVVTTPPLLRDDATNSQEWTQNETGRTDHFNARLAALARRHPDTVHLVDLGGFLCPGGSCRSEIDGAHVRPDGLHFGPEDRPVVARWLAGRLRELAPAVTAAR
jgi:peptidoglycan/LPS O-acetylase OafA/YrhL